MTPTTTSAPALLGRALLASWRGFPAMSLGGALCGVAYGASVALYGYSIGLATDSVVDSVSSRRGAQAQAVVLVCALLLLFGTGRFVLRLGRRVIANLLQFEMQRATRVQVLERVGRFALRGVVGQIQSRFGADVDEAWVFLMVLPTAVALLVMTLVGVVLLLNINVLLAAVGFVGFMLVAGGSVVYQRHQERRTLVAQNLRGEVGAFVDEVVSKHATIVGFSGEARHMEMFEDVNWTLRNARLDVGGVRSLFESLLDTVVPASTVMMLIIGVVLVDSRTVSGGDVVRAVFLTNLLFLPLRGLGPLLAELPRSSASLRRLAELLGSYPGAEEHPEANEDDGLRACAVELRCVCVTDDMDRVGLERIDLMVEPGRPVIVVGAHADGVDTLTAVVRGTVDPDAGHVLRHQDASCSAGPLVVVEEHPFILRATLRENVCLGKRLSEAEFRDVIRAAALEQRVLSLREGADAIVSEEGRSLSAGERQRVGIARALARRPGVLLLNRTTSSLDPVTERAVIKGVAGLPSPPAVLLVSERAADHLDFAEVIHLRCGRRSSGSP